ncbi:Protein of unknown function [Pyronema omphalodes CBS 100304]|uniref:Uncharacterized protein n=1 Tax=Pyronema omphalodes (strain CBS 100304) TaxID=1076935 RepID=U4LGQ1_PYROM|nr:Protein of unknown function [Pyronema omphalodes CBS 100304]
MPRASAAQPYPNVCVVRLKVRRTRIHARCAEVQCNCNFTLHELKKLLALKD